MAPRWPWHARLDELVTLTVIPLGCNIAQVPSLGCTKQVRLLGNRQFGPKPTSCLFPYIDSSQKAEANSYNSPSTVPRCGRHTARRYLGGLNPRAYTCTCIKLTCETMIKKVGIRRTDPTILIASPQLFFSLLLCSNPAIYDAILGSRRGSIAKR